ncbi:LPXTG cell wall anchor domain-containing protein [Glycomyces tenuis]|uniref:LPXTG cell wall anchor domain-containing protein n=1 Tax=Glycomyces tenuis TaxID=58116 RepID=UPI0012DC2921|nr:LPXTG cell wall anchor domain-containing protein [Glycomyces tenuis]
MDETEDHIQISDEYGTWEYDPSMDHSTEHEPGDYDLSVSDHDIEGAVGDTTTVSVDIANLGPLDAVAPVHNGAGEGSYSVRIQLPSGTESAWEGDGPDDYFSQDGVYCSLARPYYLIDRSLPTDTGITESDIRCFFDSISVAEGAHLEFPVTVTDAAPSEDGIIAITESMELDADYGNNVAVLSLNGAQATPGGDGGTDETDASGKLPATGNSSTIMISAAAAAIAAGAAVFFVMRRRRVARHWE